MVGSVTVERKTHSGSWGSTKIKFYAELNGSGTADGDSVATGIYGESQNFQYKVNVFSSERTDTINIMLKYKNARFEIGFNFNYHFLTENFFQNQDDKAKAVALYFSPRYKKLSLAMQVELFDDGNTFI